jgi:hypothetical protein
VNSYSIGNAARASVTFRDVVTGAVVDPTTVTVLVKNPAGVTTSYVYGVDSIVQKESTGKYYVTIDCNAVGEWKYRWLGTGANQAASESSFQVTGSSF